MHQSILKYNNYRYLKLALLATVTAILAYAFHTPLGPPNGGTWLGYALGGVSAALVVWLTWYGIRKRRYRPGTVRTEAWLSAHVYLGLALIVVATLHTGFQLGLNVHTLAYVLMMLVILSGLFGVYSYIRHPGEMTENRRGDTLDGTMLAIADLDSQCREVAIRLGEEINAAVFEASQNTRVGGGLFRQLSGRDPSCPTTAALDRVQALAATGSEDGAALRQLVSLLSRQCELLGRARRDVRLRALMRVWLFIHVPVTVALLAALIGHVFAVFYYW